MQILNSANAIFVVTVLLLMQFDCFFHVAVPLHSALKLYIWKVLSSSFCLKEEEEAAATTRDDYENILKYVKQNRSRIKRGHNSHSVARTTTI